MKRNLSPCIVCGGKQGLVEHADSETLPLTAGPVLVKEIFGFWHVECYGCGAFVERETADKAAEEWNRRNRLVLKGNDLG